MRDIAQKAGLPTASKRDSSGLCFVGRRRDFGSFLEQYLPEPSAPGDFVDVDTSEAVGSHEGSARYTIGQGAGILGTIDSRYFVCGKGDGDSANAVFVCRGTHHPALYTDELYADPGAFNWISLPPRPPPPPARRVRKGSGEDGH